MLALVTKHLVKVGARQLELSNLEKELWPGEGITKADLISYYVSIAPRLLPHLHQRPLTLTRYPDGINAAMFYQKDTPSYAPNWLPTYSTFSVESDRQIRYLLVEEVAALAWLANQAVIEIHPWMSTTTHPDYPDYAIIDLDPAQGTTLADTVFVAGLIHMLLDKMNLTGFPKLSGATGLHIYIPILPRYTYQQTSQFVGYIGKLVVAMCPEKATNERLVRKRDGKVYIDHLQNLPGKTIVAPYSPRPRPGAPISIPLDWQELGHVQPGHFHIKNALAVLNHPSAFDNMYDSRHSLDHVLPLINA